MHARKRRRCLAWIWGCLFIALFLFGIKKTYKYIVMEKLKANLKPGEFIVDLDDFSIDNFLQVNQPGIDPLLQQQENISVDNLVQQFPDTRPAICLSTVDIPAVQSVSIIIVFQDSLRLQLLKTLYSLLLRSPPELVEEVILVDDGSNDANTGELLSRISKVKVIRNQKPEGLMRSYNLAASLCTGFTMVFLSPYCEVNVGWLQPLVNRLLHNPTAVVVPVLDKIDNRGQYSASDNSLKGGFDWSLMFRWENINGGADLINGRILRTPVYTGHAFGIKKERFLQLGKFDPNLEVTGGENFELSFKSWLCGGCVEILTCSRVGQYYLDAEIHGITAGKEIAYMKNIKRIAEVWMDDYKRFFYYTKPSARMMNVGSVLERKSLRKSLKCQNFKWYLDNIYPELRLPVTDEIMYGNIRQNNLCVDIEIGHVPAVAKLTECDNDRGTQDWSFKKKGEISNGGMCLTADSIDTHGYVMIHFCTRENSQKWKYLNGQIYREGTDMCLDSHKAEIGLVISQCEELLDSQKWKISSTFQHVPGKDEV